MAALNNAEWCDVVCRSHGLQRRFDDEAWSSQARTPPLYPDAVTLVPDLSVPELLTRVDASMGCSIKDSFGSLDLSSFGFRVLFDAEWIVRTTGGPPPGPSGQRWEVVRDSDAFTTWERAWRGEHGPPGPLSADLLDCDSVVVVGARVGDRVVAGAVLNRGAGVVGISNFFPRSRAATASWIGCVEITITLFPESILVGYGSGDTLHAARAGGFETAGALRVWLCDS